mmetsp:Transcript_4286/g.13751  ORF Transcript_4286/g.13751 Transcript_4286/m.13751 type:complete len:216 (-) Transcript_4286:20-667(-)
MHGPTDQLTQASKAATQQCCISSLLQVPPAGPARSGRRGGAQLQRLETAGGHLLHERHLHLVLEHAHAQPLVAVADDLLGLELLQLPSPIEVLDRAVDGRREEEEDEEGADIRLLPEVLLLKVLAEGESLNLSQEGLDRSLEGGHLLGLEAEGHRLAEEPAGGQAERHVQRGARDSRLSLPPRHSKRTSTWRGGHQEALLEGFAGSKRGREFGRT